MWRPSPPPIKKTTKKQTNKSLNKKVNKTNLNYFKFQISVRGLPNAKGTILMNIVLILTAHCQNKNAFKGFRFLFLCAESLLVISKSTGDKMALSRLHLVSEGGEGLFWNLTQFHRGGGSFGIPPVCLPPGTFTFEIKAIEPIANRKSQLL